MTPVEEIKSRLDIVEVIGSYLRLKKSGANYSALCPFHSEKTPSFFVSPKLQIFKCFGCGQAGDIFKFVMLFERVEFGDALRMLAKRAGVELQSTSPELQTERKRMYEICELSCRFFEKQMENEKGKLAKEYLSKRGISEESIKKWRIGWAPDVFGALVNFLSNKGYKKSEILKAGVAIEGEDKKIYDRFRGRIMFPVFDLSSQVIGFGGRVFLKEEGAKYINTPNTILYDKSKVLYGLNFAKSEIRNKDFALLVEGYIDVILAHQIGFGNTVSSSGTSLSQFQLDLLYRFSENLYLAFDMDPGGFYATERGIDLAQLKGFNIKIVQLPHGTDPGDIISKDEKEFKRLVESANSIMEFYFNIAFSQYSLSDLEDRKKILKLLLPPIKRIQNKVEKSWWIGELSKRLKVREEDLYEQLNSISIEEKREEKEEVMVPSKSRREMLEEKLISLAIKQKELINSVDEEIVSFMSPPAKEILSYLKGKEKELSAGARDLFAVCQLRAELEELEKEMDFKEWRICVLDLKKIGMQEKLKEIAEKIKEAETKKEEKELEELKKEFAFFSQKLSQLSQK
jgi:DNA primase